MPEAPCQSEVMWVYPREDPEWKEQIVREFHIHPVTAQVFVSRGFSTLDEINNYLYSQLPDLLDPFLLTGMDRAVTRVIQAISKKEPILVYGDNDVDGMTGTALLAEFLKSVGAEVFPFVANRGAQRDRLIVEALSFAEEKGCRVLITVDCGVTAGEEIAQITKKGIDVIVTDHHEPTAGLPDCIATLNPKLYDSSYPNRDITGVGVAFKLAHGLTNKLVASGALRPQDVDLKKYLDLVALGTISDMGALLGENRILVRYGLRQMQQGTRVGLLKLCEVCEVDLKQITTMDIASKLAPRLNSLGRISDPQKGVDLLLIENLEEAKKMAEELDLNNIERQRIERTMSTEVEQYILDHPEILDHRAIVLHSENWHPGVIAIVGARIMKQYNRPTCIIAVENGVGKGSMRSIHEFPLLPVLKGMSDILVNYGGHDFAAGLTIPVGQIDQFRAGFLRAANEALVDEDIRPKLQLDAEAKFEDLTFDFLESLKLMEPFGNENPPPLLFSDTVQAWPPKVVGKTHMKLYLQQDDDRLLEGIAFGMGHRNKELRKKNLNLCVVYTPHVNMFQNKASIQLMVKDLHILNEQL